MQQYTHCFGRRHRRKYIKWGLGKYIEEVREFGSGCENKEMGERRGKRPEGEKYSGVIRKKKQSDCKKSNPPKKIQFAQPKNQHQCKKIFAEKNLGKFSEGAKNKGLKKKRRKERGEEIAVRNSLIGIINQKTESKGGERKREVFSAHTFFSIHSTFITYINNAL